MFKKVLVANRGEIARRVIRTCRKLGIKTIAVYSEADRGAPHTKDADEAYLIGGPAPKDSYLRGDVIIQLALDKGAEAIHPGYGFLAENPILAEQVSNAGLTFIGPSSHAIKAMGDKISAREIMISSGVPVVPGSREAAADLTAVQREVDKIGLPILLKAAAGGGGKGMRIVRQMKDLPEAFRMAQNEARGAFGDDRVFVERYLSNPRHIEFQVLGDGRGGAIHLGERECSIQRRHQKLIEECPSTILSDAERESMGQAAVQAAESVNYLGAGTVEFIYEEGVGYYFLEMNTRLQVEHPVTEMVYGVDLVECQLSLASGNGYGVDKKLKPKGWAIECRILAEDPFSFLPATGRIKHLIQPNGNGIRIDTGVEAGSSISPFYDSMIAKLISYAPNRHEAALNMEQALQDYLISGLTTNIPLHIHIMKDKQFLDGKLSTHFLSDINWPECYQISESDKAKLLCIAAAIKSKHYQGKIPHTQVAHLRRSK